MPSRPCLPCLPRCFIGRHGHFNGCSACEGRIASRFELGGRHFTQPHKLVSNCTTAPAVDPDGTRRGHRRWRCDSAGGSARTAGARRRASAFAAFLTLSRCRDGMIACSCPDHSRSRGLREDGQFGHLDKVFDELAENKNRTRMNADEREFIEPAFYPRTSVRSARIRVLFVIEFHSPADPSDARNSLISPAAWALPWVRAASMPSRR